MMYPCIRIFKNLLKTEEKPLFHTSVNIKVPQEEYQRFLPVFMQRMACVPLLVPSDYNKA